MVDEKTIAQPIQGVECYRNSNCCVNRPDRQLPRHQITNVKQLLAENHRTTELLEGSSYPFIGLLRRPHDVTWSDTINEPGPLAQQKRPAKKFATDEHFQ